MKPNISILFSALCFLIGSSVQANQYNVFSVGKTRIQLYDSLSTEANNDSPTVKPKTYRTANLFGVGGLLLHDTYLSPMKYGGVEAAYLYDRIDRAFRSNVWLSHYRGELYVGSTTNPAGNANLFDFGLDFSYALMHRLPGLGPVGAYIGPGLGLAVGSVYSSRNGNNPATLKLHGNIQLQLLAVYRLPCERFPVRFQLQCQASVIGSAYAPAYGESYYEAFSLYDRPIGRGLRFVHPGNFFAREFLLSTDLPIARFATLRVGYGLRSLDYTLQGRTMSRRANTFYLGYVLELKAFGGRNAMTGGDICPPL